MKIVSVQFDYGASKKYDILSQVLEYSIGINCPKADLEMLRISPPVGSPTKTCFAANTLKLQKWLDIMEATDDNIIFLDCDMLVLRDLSDVFNEDFDIGLTIKGTGSIPYNGGAVFVRNNTKAHDFIKLWNEVNIFLFNNRDEHNKWRNSKGYAGMNQAALGCLIETKKYDAKVKEFQCAIWNLCKNNWMNINENSRILHVKSALRSAVFSQSSAVIKNKYKKAIETWTEYAIDAGVDMQLKRPVIGNDENNISKRRIKRRRTWFEKTLGKPYAENIKKPIRHQGKKRR